MAAPTSQAAGRARPDAGPAACVLYRFRLGPAGDPTFVFVSDECFALYGFSAEDAMADVSLMHDAIPRDRRADFAAAGQLSLTELTPLSWVGPIRRPDGTTIQVVVSSRPQRLGDGSTEWVGMVAPTHPTQDQIPVDDPRSRLGGALDVLGMVGHDFAGPLTAILTYAELASDVLVDTSRPSTTEHSVALRRYLDVITRQSRRLDVMRRDLLALATSEAIALDLEVQRTGVLPHLVAAGELVRSPLTVTVTCAEELACMVQPSRLGQIVDNLVANAARHARARIELEATSAGPWVRITVKDDGPGVAPEVVGRLFTAFAHADLERRPDGAGSGLGLHIVRTLALACHGTVSYVGDDGGAAFVVDVPSA